MNAFRPRRKEKGFTLAEMLVSTTVFLVMAAGAFSLLSSTSQRYKTDSQVLTSFQEARLGLDQITRDISDAGFPPKNHFTNPGTPVTSYSASPFAWTPGYPAVCAMIGGCTSPNGFDLIVETQFDANGVQWIRYQLPAGTSTLLRGVTPKTGGDPGVATAGVMVPYIQNVMNDASGAQINAIRANYPAMFPGGVAVPVFTYMCDVVGGSPAPCTVANVPADIRDVEITLIVQAPSRDAQTEELRLVQLHGRGHRVNPNR